MSDLALLLTDVQESFRHSGYWTDADLSAFVTTVRLRGCFCTTCEFDDLLPLPRLAPSTFDAQVVLVPALCGFQISPCARVT